MPPTHNHECTRVPVTALASSGRLLIAAEGPFLRFYHGPDFKPVASEKIFEAQVIHGISVCTEKKNYCVLLIWGGPLLRVLEINIPLPVAVGDLSPDVTLDLEVSPITRASDWIFDLVSRPCVSSARAEEATSWVCAAVTARNALIELTVQKNDLITISLAELTTASRCILYSAHVLWVSPGHVLVAAGTAFGEVLVWSWMRKEAAQGFTHVHEVFLGHEGSIFGVCISEEWQMQDGKSRRLLASCSDDRSIRVWNLPDTSPVQKAGASLQEDYEKLRTRHTGFKATYEDEEPSHPACLAVGWGHLSRIWSVRFLKPHTNPDLDITDLRLLSTGEDATSRVWRIKPSKTNPGSHNPPYTLEVMSTAAHHSGKNIWASAVFGPLENLKMISGAADSKIAMYDLPLFASGEERYLSQEYTVEEICKTESAASRTQVVAKPQPKNKSKASQRSSKNAEFFRSYCFVDASRFVLTTNSGNVFLGHLEHTSSYGRPSITTEKLGTLEDLHGYSICAGLCSIGLVFLAGANGSIYSYNKDSPELSKVCQLQGKVTNLFTAAGTDSGSPVLLVTLISQSTAQLLLLDKAGSSIDKKVEVPLSEITSFGAVTSMIHVHRNNTLDYLFLGFRRGRITIYALPDDKESALRGDTSKATLVKTIDNAHNKESVTSMIWIPEHEIPFTGHLFSVGRDGFCAVHHVDITSLTVTLAHRAALPVGTNLEGMYVNGGHLLVYGFQSTKFILHDCTIETEVMSVECGGAHRSWAFQPHHSSPGGTLVWTRASTMQVYSRDSPSHVMIRTGCHGREIKALAISPDDAESSTSTLIATGAEDTLIKIFKYENGDRMNLPAPELVCYRTLRKHSTGIQHLQWSDDCEYFFSSGGCEEFYVWKVKDLPLIGLGVHCEAVCAPHSEDSDLRIMSFNVRQSGAGFVICMVYSDSSMRIYTYHPELPTKWKFMAGGSYTSSCLTQCCSFAGMVVTSGTDGYIASWPLPFRVSEDNNDLLSPSTQSVVWEHRVKIHQNSQKTLVAHKLSSTTTLLASGGDDGSLGLVLASAEDPEADPFSLALVVPRAHAAAISAAVVWSPPGVILMLTAGNDQWVTMWQLISLPPVGHQHGSKKNGKLEPHDRLNVYKMCRMRTNIADVSDMAILKVNDYLCKVVIVGVGMEILCIHY